MTSLTAFRRLFFFREILSLWLLKVKPVVLFTHTPVMVWKDCVLFHLNMQTNGILTFKAAILLYCS